MLINTKQIDNYLEQRQMDVTFLSLLQKHLLFGDPEYEEKMNLQKQI